MSLRPILFSILLVFAGAISAFAETRLIMVEEEGCMWCARWNDEISAIYPKTSEGRTAPLQRVDIHAPLPSDLTFERSLSLYTDVCVGCGWTREIEDRRLPRRRFLLGAFAEDANAR